MSQTLFLVPTEPERRQLAPALAAGLDPASRIELCGFGPVAAAARAAALITEHVPQRVMLIGIAGRFDARLEIGAAYRFDRVACYGVGAGSGDGFISAAALGWSQWPGDPPDPEAAVGDVIDCGAEAAEAGGPSGLLLTACAASATADDVARRTKLFPAAVAEDMEGFGVALACRLCATPVDIVRGISNTAGDRAKSRWRVSAALEAAAAIVLALMAEAS